MDHARALTTSRRARVITTGLLSAAAASALASSAGASGFSTARFGGEHGNVTESNPTAVSRTRDARSGSVKPCSPPR